MNYGFGILGERVCIEMGGGRAEMLGLGRAVMFSRLVFTLGSRGEW